MEEMPLYRKLRKHHYVVRYLSYYTNVMAFGIDIFIVLYKLTGQWRRDIYPWPLEMKYLSYYTNILAIGGEIFILLHNFTGFWRQNINPTIQTY